MDSDGNPTPSAQRYPQPKGSGSVGSGGTNVAPESKDQLSKAASASGYKHGSARPKGV